MTFPLYRLVQWLLQVKSIGHKQVRSVGKACLAVFKGQYNNISDWLNVDIFTVTTNRALADYLGILYSDLRDHCQPDLDYFSQLGFAVRSPRSLAPETFTDIMSDCGHIDRGLYCVRMAVAVLAFFRSTSQENHYSLVSSYTPTERHNFCKLPCQLLHALLSSITQLTLCIDPRKKPSQSGQHKQLMLVNGHCWHKYQHWRAGAIFLASSSKPKSNVSARSCRFSLIETVQALPSWLLPVQSV